jgi:hypothetical protein
LLAQRKALRTAAGSAEREREAAVQNALTELRRGTLRRADQ